MCDDSDAVVYEKLRGCTFSVEDDPDFPAFYSVYADRGGTGCEVAGKIGERAVAEFIASALLTLCREVPHA